MILVCPSCDAKFKIPDGAIPAGGRTVRCATCKNSWHAKSADIMRKKAPVARPATRPGMRPATSTAPRPVGKHHNVNDPAVAAEAGALRQSVRANLEDDVAETASATEDDLFEDGDGTATPAASSSSLGDDDFIANLGKASGIADDLDDDDDILNDDDEEYDEDDFLSRRRAGQRKQNERDASSRRALLMNIGWGGLIFFWLLTFYVFIFEQERMVYKFPGTKNFYSMFEGVSDKERFRPEPGEKLTPSPAKAEVYISAKLNNLRTKVEQVDGQNRLMVRGFVENLGTTGAHVPKVLVEIVNSRNQVLDKWVTEPAGRLIRRRGKVNFETSRDVPLGIASVRVSVIKGSKSSIEGAFPE